MRKLEVCTFFLSFFLTDILGFNGMEDAPAHIAEDPSTLGIFVGMDVAGSKILGGEGGLPEHPEWKRVPGVWIDGKM